MKYMKPIFWTGLGVLLLAVTFFLSTRTASHRSVRDVETSPLPSPDAAADLTASVDSQDAPSQAASAGPTIEPLLVGSSADFGLTVTPIEGSSDQWIDIKLNGFQVLSNAFGSVIKIDGQGIRLTDGEPDLPTLVHAFPGRPGESAHVEVTEVNYTDHEGYTIAPRARQRSDGSVSHSEDPEIYGVDRFWPPEAVDIQEAYQGRRKFVRVEYRPFQYNPETGVLRQAESIRARLSYGPEEAYRAAALSGVSGFDDTDLVSDPEDCGCSERRVTPATLLPPMNGHPQDFARRRAGADVNACIKIKVHAGGIHTLTYGTLLAAGVDDAEITGSNLRMFYKDRELAIAVSTNGKFTHSTDHTITFYAEPFESFHTDENVYWLGFGPGGLRMTSRSVTDDASLGAPDTVACRRITLDDKLYYGDNLVDYFREKRMEIDDGSYTGWFLGTIANPSGIAARPPLQVNLSGTDHAVPGSLGRVTGTLFAYLGSSHRFRIRNASNAFILDYPIAGGSVRDEMDQPFAASSLNASGTTALKIEGNAGVLDGYLVPSLTFEFDRSLYTTDDRLSFGGTAGDSRYELRNFAGTGADIMILDVTDGYDPVRLRGFSTFNSAPGRGVRMVDRVTYHPCYTSVGQTGAHAVLAADVQSALVRNLADPSRQVDYLVIATAGYEDEVHRLLDHRDFTGLEVLVVTDEDVYNEFSYGVSDCSGIKQFIGYAFHHWAREPQYVLLVGDTTYDPLNVLEAEQQVLPSPFGPTSFLFASIDMTFAMVNGDDQLIDLAIGRLPVKNLTELKNIVDKIILYEAQIKSEPITGTWRSQITLVSGKVSANGDNFGGDSDLINTQIIAPSPHSATILKNPGGSGDPLRAQIISQINAGRFLVNYMGHGASTAWDGGWPDTPIFKNVDIDLMTNNRFPIVSVFTCANGVYQYPATQCSAEKFVVTPNHGAIAVIAPSAFAIHQVSEQMNREMYNALLNNLYVDGLNGAQLIHRTQNTQRLGEAYINGMLAMFLGIGNQSFELQFYNLLGDPGLLVSPE
jgi:hypothetical protein